MIWIKKASTCKSPIQTSWRWRLILTTAISPRPCAGPTTITARKNVGLSAGGEKAFQPGHYKTRRRRQGAKKRAQRFGSGGNGSHGNCGSEKFRRPVFRAVFSRGQ